jgi:Zn-dependent peptidase ImmA (M78 family)/DNA-binding XRE family transcriptional regulator
MIGRRLKLARQGCGLSLRALETKIDNIVSAQAIGKYERDEMMPSSTTLIALAKALGVSEAYLLGQGDLQLQGVEFRKKKITSKKEEAHISATVINHIERYLEIEDIIHSSSIEWDQPREAPFPVHTLQDAEYAAEKLRYHWHLGTSPIANLAEFLEERGIKVLSLPLATSVSGLTCWVKRRNGTPVPIIVINENNKGERQRFTLAHELGHMVLDISPNLDEESPANRFSGAFLVPADILRAEIGKHRNNLTLGELIRLKSLFGVSIQALTYRCKDLEIINSKVFQDLFAEFSRRGWRTPPYEEPVEIPIEKPSRFERLCFRAVAEDAINEVKAAELLGITVRKLKQMMEQNSSDEEKSENA